jgi:4'-phosphopantetheinyl transferase
MSLPFQIAFNLSEHHLMRTQDGALTSWLLSPGRRRFVEPGCVHVWRMDLTCADADNHASVLSFDERAREARFVFERDRNRFSRARIGLRHVLSSYLEQAPAEIGFVQNEFGKPNLVGESRIGFNVSHSDDTAVIAVGQFAEIGVDVERVRRPTDIRGIAKSVFSIFENEALDSLEGNALLEAFFTCWTRKEAYLKAIGVGLALAPASVTVGVLPYRSAVPVIGLRTSADCEVVTIHRDEQLVISLATVGTCKGVEFFNLNFEG